MNEPRDIVMAAQDKAIGAATESEHASEHMMRAVNEVISKKVAEYLSEQDLPTKDVILLLHQMASQGIYLWDDESQGYIAQGGLRTELVSIDTIVPPKPEDVAKLFDLLCEKVDALLPTSTSINIQVLALWTHAVLMVIHPFNDANGRTGRALVDYMIQKTMKPRNNDEPSGYLDYSHEGLREVAYSEITKLQYDLRIVPCIAEQSESGIVQVNTTSMDMYYASLADGRPDKYFAAIKTLVVNHINSIKSIEDIQQFHGLRDYQRLLEAAKKARKYSTVNLAATEAQEAVQQHLTRTESIQF